VRAQRRVSERGVSECESTDEANKRTRIIWESAKMRTTLCEILNVIFITHFFFDSEQLENDKV